MGRRKTSTPYHACGELTKKNCPCRIRVPFEGVKCRFHTDGAQGFECAICLETGQADGYRLRCGHTYHEACIHRWLSTSACPTCPTCRRPVKDGRTIAWVEEFSTAGDEWLPEEALDDDIPLRVQRTRARRRQAALEANQSILEQILSILMPA